ncbi:hypothetical protein BRC79_08040 [Halobacteriales archaeon QH_8_67_27]|nr:MAG: hypothetical protein BRC79_08040 [Halobacteriales archaeon QH_8_67_27]
MVSGFTNRPVEGNELSDIDGTAMSVEGGVLAPVRTNSIDGAQRGIVVADGAEAAAITGNELRNVRDSEDGASSASTATPDSVAATTTPGDSGVSEGAPAAETGSPGTPPQAGTGSDDEPGESGGATTDSGSASGSGPGFGLGSAVATLGGAGYLVAKRLGTDESADED